MEFSRFFSRSGLTPIQAEELMLSFVDRFEGTKAVKGVDVVRGMAEIRQAAKDLHDSVPYNYAMKALGFPEIHASHRNPYVFARQLKEDYAVRLPHHERRALYPWLNVTLTNRKDVIEKYEQLTGSNGRVSG